MIKQFSSNLNNTSCRGPRINDTKQYGVNEIQVDEQHHESFGWNQSNEFCEPAVLTQQQPQTKMLNEQQQIQNNDDNEEVFANVNVQKTANSEVKQNDDQDNKQEHDSDFDNFGEERKQEQVKPTNQQPANQQFDQQFAQWQNATMQQDTKDQVDFNQGCEKLYGMQKDNTVVHLQRSKLVDQHVNEDFNDSLSLSDQRRASVKPERPVSKQEQRKQLDEQITNQNENEEENLQLLQIAQSEQLLQMKNNNPSPQVFDEIKNMLLQNQASNKNLEQKLQNLENKLGQVQSDKNSLDYSELKGQVAVLTDAFSNNVQKNQEYIQKLMTGFASSVNEKMEQHLRKSDQILEQIQQDYSRSKSPTSSEFNTQQLSKIQQELQESIKSCQKNILDEFQNVSQQQSQYNTLGGNDNLNSISIQQADILKQQAADMKSLQLEQEISRNEHVQQQLQIKEKQISTSQLQCQKLSEINMKQAKQLHQKEVELALKEQQLKFKEEELNAASKQIDFKNIQLDKMRLDVNQQRDKLQSQQTMLELQNERKAQWQQEQEQVQMELKSRSPYRFRSPIQTYPLQQEDYGPYIQIPNISQNAQNYQNVAYPQQQTQSARNQPFKFQPQPQVLRQHHQATQSQQDTQTNSRNTYLVSASQRNKNNSATSVSLLSDRSLAPQTPKLDQSSADALQRVKALQISYQVTQQENERLRSQIKMQSQNESQRSNTSQVTERYQAVSEQQKCLQQLASQMKDVQQKQIEFEQEKQKTIMMSSFTIPSALLYTHSQPGFAYPPSPIQQSVMYPFQQYAPQQQIQPQYIPYQYPQVVANQPPTQQILSPQQMKQVGSPKQQIAESVINIADIRAPFTPIDKNMLNSKPDVQASMVKSVVKNASVNKSESKNEMQIKPKSDIKTESFRDKPKVDEQALINQNKEEEAKEQIRKQQEKIEAEKERLRKEQEEQQKQLLLQKQQEQKIQYMIEQQKKLAEEQQRKDEEKKKNEQIQKQIEQDRLKQQQALEQKKKQEEIEKLEKLAQEARRQQEEQRKQQSQPAQTSIKPTPQQTALQSKPAMTKTLKNPFTEVKTTDPFDANMLLNSDTSDGNSKLPKSNNMRKNTPMPDEKKEAPVAAKQQDNKNKQKVIQPNIMKLAEASDSCPGSMPAARPPNNSGSELQQPDDIATLFAPKRNVMQPKPEPKKEEKKVVNLLEPKKEEPKNQFALINQLAEFPSDVSHVLSQEVSAGDAQPHRQIVNSVISDQDTNQQQTKLISTGKPNGVEQLGDSAKLINNNKGKAEVAKPKADQSSAKKVVNDPFGGQKEAKKDKKSETIKNPFGDFELAEGKGEAKSESDFFPF